MEPNKMNAIVLSKIRTRLEDIVNPGIRRAMDIALGDTEANY